MSKKFPKPFFVKSRGLWYVQIRGKQHNLGRDEQAAFRLYHELMAKPVIVPVASHLVAGVIEGFLAWCSEHRSPRTYEWYTNHLQSFVGTLANPKTMAVDELKPFHVEQWVRAHIKTWGPNHRRGAITAVQRAFTWAEKMGHILKSPIRHIEKPKPKRREQVLDADQFGNVLTKVKDQAFRDVLEFCWQTGSRVQEVRLIEADDFRSDLGRVELPPERAKGNRRRLIYLNDRAAEIVKRLAVKHPSGPIFRNFDGNPWNAQAFNNRFCRLQKKVGVKYALTAIRHSFATRMLEAGIGHLTVSSLLGHAAGSTILADVYSHLGQRGDFLRDELLKGSDVENAA